jgi:hypothetical protein
MLLGWLASAVQGAESWRPWPFNDDKPGKPDRVIALWTDTVLTRTNTPPVRGFGGRLMFYEGKKESPIKVEGTLVVYAFDETGRDPDSARPDRKYVFTPEQFPAHYSKSKIGHSYSVWIPWDEVGGIQKDITLIVRFEAKNSSPIVGEQHRMLLPGMTPPRAGENGTLPPGAIANAMGANGVRRTSYEATAPDDAAGQNSGGRPRRMTTDTISVPSDLASRPGFTGPTATPPAAQRYSPPWSNQQRQGASPGFQSPQASSPTSSYWTQQPTGSPLGRLRPLGAPLARLDRDRAQWPQRLEGSPSAPASQPGSNYANGSQANQPSGGQGPN